VDPDEVVAEREDGRLQPRVHAELREDVRDVVALGPDGDAQPVGDRLAVQSVR